MSAQGIIHLLADQAPTIGMLAMRIAASVVRRSCGPKRAGRGGALPSAAPFPWRASHCGDSGSAASTASPSTAGSPAIWKSQRHESAVIGQTRPHCERAMMPTLMPAAITPDTVALLAAGQLSATSAMPLGHTPPTPSPTKNRSASSCREG
ncbi:MAG: hypothetical protein WCH77_05730 [Planctomycetota bacterium]